MQHQRAGHDPAARIGELAPADSLIVLPARHALRCGIPAKTRRHGRMADLQGKCDERFGAVADALQRNVDSGAELGASIVLDLDGEIAVDLWGGYRDEARTQ